MGEKCKQCGHDQKYHQPYYDGKGWHCTKDNCDSWQLCKKPEPKVEAPAPQERKGGMGKW